MTGIWDPNKRLLTINEAAHSIHRPESTIRRWISEGRLKPRAFRWQSFRNQDLYLEADILKVEAATRHKPRMTQ